LVASKNLSSKGREIEFKKVKHESALVDNAQIKAEVINDSTVVRLSSRKKFKEIRLC
jgi:hypothetical protein